jgi:hypothetical protein
MYLQKSHLCIPAENEVTSVIMVHGCNLIVKHQFINNPASAEIEYLVYQWRGATNQVKSIQVKTIGQAREVHDQVWSHV